MVKISPSRELCRSEGKGHSSRHTIEAGFEIAFALKANNLLGDLSLIKQQKGWNRSNAVFSGQSLLLINIHFTNSDAGAVFLGEFVQNGYEGAAGITPLCPKIYQDGCLRLQNLSREIFLG